MDMPEHPVFTGSSTDGDANTLLAYAQAIIDQGYDMNPEDLVRIAERLRELGR